MGIAKTCMLIFKPCAVVRPAIQMATGSNMGRLLMGGGGKGSVEGGSVGQIVMAVVVVVRGGGGGGGGARASLLVECVFVCQKWGFICWSSRVGMSTLFFQNYLIFNS